MSQLRNSSIVLKLRSVPRSRVRADPDRELYIRHVRTQAWIGREPRSDLPFLLPHIARLMSVRVVVKASRVQLEAGADPDSLSRHAIRDLLSAAVLSDDGDWRIRELEVVQFEVRETVPERRRDARLQR